MKFSIRDLFLVTVIVALAVACLVIHNGNIYAEKNAKALEDVLKAEGWRIHHYDSDMVIDKLHSSPAYMIRKGELSRLPTSSTPASNP